MRTCGYPGCTVSIEGRHKCTRWCIEHSLAIQRSRKSRKEAYGHRKKHAAPRMNVIKRTVITELPRKAQLKCKVCADMPWARCPERRCDGKGDLSVSERPLVIGTDGRCRGCGLAYAPEPELKRGTLIVSSMARALVEMDR